MYTSFGVREIRAVSAKRDTSGGSREDWVVVVEHLRTLLFLLWLITTCEKLKLELLLLHLKLKIWFFGAILDTPFSISNALLPIFLEILGAIAMTSGNWKRDLLPTDTAQLLANYTSYQVVKGHSDFLLCKQ